MNDWSQFCLVGYGRHAKAQLLPALENNGSPIHSVVTSKSDKGLSSRYRLFPNLETALKFAPPGTCFIVSTPPSEHFLHTRMIIESGHDVLLEKPGFVCIDHLKNILRIVKVHQFCGVAYMYKHSQLFKFFKNHWAANRFRSRSLDLRFLLPAIPFNTFRSDTSVENSIVFDIGCYIADTLVELDIDVSSIKVNELQKKDGVINYVSLSGCGTPRIFAEFGFGFAYTNCLSLTYDDMSVRNFGPFYWGRSGTRTVETLNKDGSEVSWTMEERNVFEIMLSSKRQQWVDDQELDTKKLLLTTRLLEHWALSAK